jgi:streptogrisin B
MRKSFVAGVVATAAALFSAAPAHADKGTLTIGMKLNFPSGNCSLGFFATDSVGDQLAITAGHCAHGLHERVFDSFGEQIGEVVARQPDAEDGQGKLTGSRGFTVVYTYKNTFNIEAFFTGTGAAKVGDPVKLYGERTTGTNGSITGVSIGSGSPDQDWIKSNLVQLPGDSGGAWYTGPGDILIGIASSGNEEQRGGDQGAYAQPLNSVIQEISRAQRYGQGFSVYIR